MAALLLASAALAQKSYLHCGGLLETKKIAAMAESHGVLVAQALPGLGRARHARVQHFQRDIEIALGRPRRPALNR